MIPAVKLHVLDLGRLRLDRSVLLAGEPEGAAVEVPVSAYLIEHAGGRILFDTGCHPLGMGPLGVWPEDFQARYPWSGGPECHLENRLAALGVRPDDVATVVLSHLHNDHAGCVELFRRAKLIVDGAELAAALGAQDDETYIRQEIARWRGLGLDWHPTGRDTKLTDHVTVLAWGGGHATGMLGLHVRLKRTGDVILASDALYCAANFAPAFRAPGFMHDPEGWEATAHGIAALAQRSGARVWFGHDPHQFATLRHAPQGYYD